MSVDPFHLSAPLEDLAGRCFGGRDPLGVLGAADRADRKGVAI